MDVVLEVFDTFVFDRLYANLLPLTPAQRAWTAVDSLFTEPNATWASMREMPTPAYTFKAASQYLSLEPSSFAYMSQMPRDNAIRQGISLFLITWIFGAVLYFSMATASYFFIFDKATFNHPRFLKNQVRMEIRQTMEAMPVMALLTVPFFLAEVRGHSLMYDTIPEGAWWSFGGWYNILQIPMFLLFTDFFIYFIHRGLHHPLIYKHLHKPHHKWIMPTPFASHAFHPLDGYAQSVPYHVFPFVFPLNKFAYIGLFTFINIWTIMIHDGEFVANNTIINGAACHSIHHEGFNFNYGQYTTLWDRIGGSYRAPKAEMFDKETKMSKERWQRQVKETDKIKEEVEGADDRVYLADAKKNA